MSTEDVAILVEFKRLSYTNCVFDAAGIMSVVVMPKRYM